MYTPLTAEMTLPDVLATRLAATPGRTAYRQYRDGQWIGVTWAEVAREVGRWQAALHAAGLKAGDRVGLCSKNRMEWVFCDQAALGLGCAVVPLFYNDRPDNMAYCLADAGVRLVVLEDGALWAQLRDHLPEVTRVVCLTNAPADDPRAVAVDRFLPAHGPALVRGPAKPDDMATLVYTSGTTGKPKGVVLTHRNIVVDSIGVIEQVFEIQKEEHELLSFLPLSHMFERTVGYYVAMALGAQVTYARSVQELGEDLLSQRPTILVTVPRIFERIYTKLEEALPAGSPKRKLFDRTVEVGWRRFKKQRQPLDYLLWPILNLLVARKVRARLGGRVQYIWLGGAGLAPHLTKVFVGMGLTFIQGYGLTETSPVLCANALKTNDPLSVGPPVPGVEWRLGANSEFQVRGPMIMKGYWKQPEATAAVLDPDGWFHTGDLVEIREGRVYIRGRAKEIIVLSTGEKVPPGDAEQAILKDAAFEQVMVVGEGRPHLGLLVVSKLTDLKDLCARANAELHGFPGYARISHIARCDEAWTVENKLLTPTLKLKRKVIEERFASEIAAMFQRKKDCG